MMEATGVTIIVLMVFLLLLIAFGVIRSYIPEKPRTNNEESIKISQTQPMSFVKEEKNLEAQQSDKNYLLVEQE